MFSNLWFLPSLLFLLCTVQAKPHANLPRHHHRSRAVAARASGATAESSDANIGIVYDGSSDLGAFSGRVGFSVDWSPSPLDSSDGLDLGTFIPQLWTFQDSNRESPHIVILMPLLAGVLINTSRTDLNPWTNAAPSWPTGVKLIGFNEPDM